MSGFEGAGAGTAAGAGAAARRAGGAGDAGGSSRALSYGTAGAGEALESAESGLFVSTRPSLRSGGTRTWLVRTLVPVAGMCAVLWVLLAGASPSSAESEVALAAAERPGAALLISSPLVPRGVPRPFWQAPRLRAVDGQLRVQLVVEPGRIAFEGGVAFNARTFNGSAVGPTLVVRRGERLVVDLWNQLGAEVEPDAESNSLRLPNTTVLHTHGLHVSPRGRADNVYGMVRPGERATYVYNISSSHPVGTFYLHPHVHGSSALQTGYSMSAAILVLPTEGEEAAAAAAAEAEAAPAALPPVVAPLGAAVAAGAAAAAARGGALGVAGAGSVGEAAAASPPAPAPDDDELVMIVGMVDAGSGRHTDLAALERESGGRLSLHLRSPFDQVGFLTVNGVRSPTVLARPGHWQLWRVVNNVGDGVLRLLWLHEREGAARQSGGDRGKDEGGELAYPCEMLEAGADGVLYAHARRVDNEAGLLVVPGSRRDLWVRCSAGARVLSGLHLRQPQAQGPAAGAGDEAAASSSNFSASSEPGDREPWPWSAGNADQASGDYLGSKTRVAMGELLHVSVGGARHPATADPAAEREQGPPPREPPAGLAGYTVEPLGDLRHHEPSLRAVVTLTQGGPATPQVVRNGRAYSFLAIDGVPFNASAPARLVAPLGAVVEWTIVNELRADGSPASESHPYHQHTNHFQVIDIASSVAPGWAPDVRLGDWRDTIALPAPGRVTVRFVARDFLGVSMIHCHTLSHQDLGMAAKYDIVASL